MTLTRDALGRFTKKREITSKLRGLIGAWDEVPDGKPLEGFDLKHILEVPEVAAVAGEGESVPMEPTYKAKKGEVLVQFWPYLQNVDTTYYDPYAYLGTKKKDEAKAQPAWQLTGPPIFVIHTDRQRDDPRSCYDAEGRGVNGHGNHWTSLVHGLNSKYVGNAYISDHQMCRGDASFLPDPFASTLELRLYLIGTWTQGAGYHMGSGGRSFWQDEEKMRMFWDRYPLPYFTLVPSFKPDVKANGVFPLTREMCEMYAKGENTEVWLPPGGEPKEIVRA